MTKRKKKKGKKKRAEGDFPVSIQEEIPTWNMEIGAGAFGSRAMALQNKAEEGDKEAQAELDRMDANVDIVKM